MRRLATALAIGASVLVAAGCGDATHVAAGPDLATATVSGLEVAYPTAFHIRRFSRCDLYVPATCVHGVVVASYRLKAGQELGARSARFRKNGVAFELYPQPADQQGTGGGVRLGDRSLALWPFQSVVHGGVGPLIRSTPPPVQDYWAGLRAGGRSYTALASVGADATPAERHALAALIKSIHAAGVTPHGALPLPPRQVVHVLCGGSPGSPRIPNSTLEADYGRICAQVTGSTCRVFTQARGAPVSAIRERHFHLASRFCGYTRRFLVAHPRGFVVEPRPSHLVLG